MAKQTQCNVPDTGSSIIGLFRNGPPRNKLIVVDYNNGLQYTGIRIPINYIYNIYILYIYVNDARLFDPSVYTAHGRGSRVVDKCGGAFHKLLRRPRAKVHVLRIQLQCYVLS